MNHSRAEAIYIALQESRGPETDDLMNDLIQAAIRYARLRVDWRLVIRGEEQALDAERKRAHNALIDACNILSRAMSARGLDIRWRAELGYDRKERRLRLLASRFGRN